VSHRPASPDWCCDTRYLIFQILLKVLSLPARLWALSQVPLSAESGCKDTTFFLFCKIFFLIISRNKFVTSERHIVTYQLFFDKIKNRPQTGQKNIQILLYFLENWALMTQQKIQYSCNKLNINEIIYIQTTWYIKQNKQNQCITKCTNINPNRALGFHT
jgi:hypothetical protein